MKSKFSLFLINIILLNAQSLDQIKKQANDAGINVDQLEMISNDKTLSNDQIKLENDGEFDNNIIKSEFNKVIDSNVDDNQLDDSSINSNSQSQDLDKLEYFGYKIFESDPSIFQSSAFGAVDPNYNIGPGDQIILMLWGESQFRQEFTIDREGYVFLPEVGQVFVNGLNLEALEKKFFQVLSKVYSTLNPQQGEPTTFMDVSIAELRPLRIIVLGEVSQPGAYLVSPTTSLSSSLYYFNGPTTFGSLRDIRLLRKGKTIGNVDFYDYLLSGNVPNDFRLQMDDVIFIPPRGMSVSIKGEINRQGIYELKDGEGLNDIINIAGNLKVSAYLNRCQITRIVPKEKRENLSMDRMLIDINLQTLPVDKQKVELFDGDTIQIFPINDLFNNYVSINGNSVSRPGKYQLTPNMKILDLIESAEGLLNDVYLEKAHIKRFNKNLTFENITINLNKLFNGDLSQNITLNPMDEFLVYNNNQINNIFSNITISGPVKNSGIYDLENGKSLGDLIILAGGFEEKIEKVKIIIARSNKNKFVPDIYIFPSKKTGFISKIDLADINHEINNFTLLPYDLITIYSDPKDGYTESVNISGSVYYPGSYPIISPNEKVSDIIRRAGGLLPSAYPMASSLNRNNNIIKLSFDKIIINNNSKENFVVKDGDQIEISTRTNIVLIEGEVREPGYYKFYSNNSLRDYLKISGGLTKEAEKNGIWITYPNGKSKRLIRYLPSPRVYDSSVITVSSKPESEPLNRTEFASDIASIISDFLQVALTVSILVNTSGN